MQKKFCALTVTEKIVICIQCFSLMFYQRAISFYYTHLQIKENEMERYNID